ncbi:MAG: TetR/AcrR family transcriptional regulator [Tagaea sp.]|nr:TetR/AcrR family transcriptional regulator [Tagaea sp.]
MARPRIPDDRSPRTDVLRAATRLLRQGGLAAAGVNRIVAESGAPKGSIYHFFPEGKSQIAREALSLYRERAIGRMRARLEARAGDPQAVVRGYFELGAEAALESGYSMSCPAGAVILDLDPASDALRDSCHAVFEGIVDDLAALLVPLADAKRRALAGAMVSAMQGAYIRARAARDPEPFREAGELLAAAIPTPRRKGKPR